MSAATRVKSKSRKTALSSTDNGAGSGIADIGILPGHGRPVLSDAQFVPVEVHKTPPSIMKMGLPKRIRALVKLHGTPLLVL